MGAKARRRSDRGRAPSCACPRRAWCAAASGWRAGACGRSSAAPGSATVRAQIPPRENAATPVLPRAAAPLAHAHRLNSHRRRPAAGGERLGRRQRGAGAHALAEALRVPAEVLRRHGVAHVAQRRSARCARFPLRRRQPPPAAGSCGLAAAAAAAGTLGGAHALHYQSDEQLDRLTTQFNMAGVLDDMGEWEEARQMYQEVIAGRRELLGPDAQETLDAQWYLAMLLMDDSGEWSASRRLWGDVASGYASAYGQCHANTQAARCCVCCCCMCMPFACCCGRRKRGGGGGSGAVDSSRLLDDAGGGAQSTTCRPRPSLAWPGLAWPSPAPELLDCHGSSAPSETGRALVPGRLAALLPGPHLQFAWACSRSCVSIRRAVRQSSRAPHPEEEGGGRRRKEEGGGSE